MFWRLTESPIYPLNYGGVGVDSRDWVGLGADGLIGGVRWLSCAEGG